MLSSSIWFSAPSFWTGGGLESRCVGRVYGADGAVHSASERDCVVSIIKIFWPTGSCSAKKKIFEHIIKYFKTLQFLRSHR